MASCLRGRKIAFLGDTACNVANSYVLGCAHMGIELALSGPKGFEPSPEILEQPKKDGLKPTFTFTTNPEEAVRGADMVTTDVWVSMGMEAEKAERLRIMQPYQVNSALMKLAKPDAFFMHCLPAHPGEEVSLEVLEGPQSIVFDQAETACTCRRLFCRISPPAADPAELVSKGRGPVSVRASSRSQGCCAGCCAAVGVDSGEKS